MKKLLNILSASFLSITLSTSAVSCSNSNDSRIDNPKLSDDILNQVNAEITNGKYKPFGQLTNKEIWNSSKDEVNNLILDLLNKQIGKDFYYKTMSTRSQNIGGSVSRDELNADFENYISDLTLNNLYQTYTKDINAGTYLETSMDEYEPDIQSTDWFATGTNSTVFVKNSTSATNYYQAEKWDQNFNWNKNYDPTKVQWMSDPKTGNIHNFTDDGTEAGKAQLQTNNFDYWNNTLQSNLSLAKQQLATRFRTYIHNDLEPTMYKNAMIDTYLQSGSYYFYDKDKYPLIRKYSPLFNTWQSWIPGSDNKWSSNIKMVWEVRFTKDTSALTGNSDFQKLEQYLSNYAKPTTSEFNADQNTLDFWTKAINWFNTTATSDKFGLKYGGESYQNSYDPIFSNNGYEGIYGITPGSGSTKGSIFTANSSNKDITSYTDAITSSDNNKPGALVNKNIQSNPSGGDSTFFTDTNGDVVLAFSMPIYLMDLVQGQNVYSSEDQTHGISYTPYDSIKDGKINNPISQYSSEYDGDKSQNNLLKQWVDMNDNGTIVKKNIASKDVENLKVDGTDNKAQDLFNLVESTIATDGLSSDGSSDSGIALNGEQALYSWAFDGNVDNIYTTDLYNKIGKYIKSDE